MFIDAKQAARLLSERDNILIFAHRKPDGDAIGSGFGLMRALHSLGKKARVECADPMIVGRMETIFGVYRPQEFQPDYFVAVDTADESLLLGIHEPYGGTIDLCVDHHGSNSGYAVNTLLDVEAAATAEAIYDVTLALGAQPSKAVADALYTGLTTDTGCFRQANTTARTHEIAAILMRWGADSHTIDKLMFSTKSKGRLNVERMLLQTLEYHVDGKCAVIFLPADVYTAYGIEEQDLDGIAAFPRLIEGVMAGVTVRDKGDGGFRVSLRTEDPVNASVICANFGGGGHRNAAGCTMEGSPESVKERLLAAVRAELAAKGL